MQAHVCESRYVCPCVWSVANVRSHPQLLFHFIHGGRASQSSLELATMASPNTQLALEIPYLPLEARNTGGLMYQLAFSKNSEDLKYNPTTYAQVSEPLSHLQSVCSSS